ncbi:hypothetical protein OU798_15030 [Prolixibacteraceae bacterium Z1-6]|uniref:Uncharacterized protein n=1 Tax=Draconibacterium aestuarii TaxID=2998507 RepID=A0A9X3F8H4_9BACT|nr:hypothetical protein [Prolixibacteraceae bacterium Z1-6]
MLENNTPFTTDKLLDEVVKAEPAYFLPDNFADVLAERVGRRFAWEQYLKEFLIYLAVIFGIFAVSAGMALIWFDVNWKGWFNFLGSHLALVAGAGILAVFILFADRVLLRYFLYKSSTERS